MRESLVSRMAKAGLREEDITESFIRSAGAGGQNVNKLSSCVYLKHLPTGIEVKCQEERSQYANRIRARRILIEKLTRRRQQQELLKEQARQKQLRAARKRPRGAKERMLEAKKRHAQKKKLRQKVMKVWE